MSCGASYPPIYLFIYLQCLADNDLGVPLPPPIVLNEGDAATREGWERLIVPPGLRERVLHACASIPVTSVMKNGLRK